METQPRYRIITYTLRLEIPEEVDVDPDSLAERILNSLMDYASIISYCRSFFCQITDLGSRAS